MATLQHLRFYAHLLLLTCGLFFASAFVPLHAVSETATASADDELAEIAVLRRVLPPELQPIPKAQSEQAAVEPSIATAVQGDPELTQASLPNLDAPVIDQAQLLKPAERSELDQKILTIFNSGRAQIGVVILPTTGQEDIFDYASRVFTAWQLGDEKHDNGLLIVVASQDREVQILTGYGLEGVLPDIMTHRIIQQYIVPAFQQQQYAAGLNAAVDRINEILQQDPEIAKQAAELLKQQQAEAAAHQVALSQSFMGALVLIFVGMIGAAVLGKGISATTSAVAGTAFGLFSGIGLIPSLFIGGGIFFLLFTSLAQVLLQIVLSGSGRGGGGGGFGGGSGYSGGGGSFGGGGASGSW